MSPPFVLCVASSQMDQELTSRCRVHTLIVYIFVLVFSCCLFKGVPTAHFTSRCRVHTLIVYIFALVFIGVPTAYFRLPSAHTHSDSVIHRVRACAKLSEETERLFLIVHRVLGICHICVMGSGCGCGCGCVCGCVYVSTWYVSHLCRGKG